MDILRRTGLTTRARQACPEKMQAVPLRWLVELCLYSSVSVNAARDLTRIFKSLLSQTEKRILLTNLQRFELVFILGFSIDPLSFRSERSCHRYVLSGGYARRS